MRKRTSIFITLIFVTILLLNTTTDVFEDTREELQGKYISILGDSISTYEGWIPEENRVYYHGDNCDVPSVAATWWKKVINNTNLKLCKNNSWSGSLVSTSRSLTSAGCMGRCQTLHKGDIYPDIIIVYMGINDFNNDVPLGRYDGRQAFPRATRSFREAYAIMLRKITSTYPDAEVYACTLPYSNVFGPKTGDNPVNTTGTSLSDYNDAIIELAELFDVTIIDFASCDFSKETLELYMGDYNPDTTNGLHPNMKGHTVLANVVLDTFYKQNRNYFLTIP